MEKRWTMKSQGDPLSVENLAHLIDARDDENSREIYKLVATLLVQRGIKYYHEAKKFFRPELSHLHDPFLIKDMDLAIDRIVKAMSDQEKILIYGDYDVDGTTAVATVYSFFKRHHDWVNFYLPDRYKEGYGISTAGIDWARENNYTLIIALDCGIKSIDKVDYAKTLGIDFIICDHHIPGDQLPAAVAVLDPKRSDCPYPYKELTGCGIGFKLVQAFADTHSIPFSEIECYLDLCAVSIASDIVPVTGENRILAHFGMERLNTNPREGFKAILNLANVKKKVSLTDVVFVIGPRINAAGRIEDAKRSVELLIAENEEDAIRAGEGIDKLNQTRREKDSIITEQALQLIHDDEGHKHRKTTVLFNPDWHKGVIGIVASRLTEHHYRPTIVLTQSDGKITGSARSVKDFDLYAALEKCGDLLEQYGGHKYAAGLTMKPERIQEFRDRFNQVVTDVIEERMLTQEIEVDSELNLEDISFPFYRILQQFAPFGPGNMAPVFLTRGVHSRIGPKIVGEKHLKLFVEQPNSPSFDAIAFQQANHLQDTVYGKTFDICYAIEENDWNGNVTLQLNIKDIKPATV